MLKDIKAKLDIFDKELEIIKVGHDNSEKNQKF